MPNIPYQNTVFSPAGGVNALTGAGMDYQFTLSGVNPASTVTLIFTDAQSGLQTQIGAGNVAGIVPTFLSAFNNKLYALSGNTTYFSAIENGAVFNDLNGAGNGFIQMANYSGTPDELKATAPYQGGLAFVFRRFVQIWNVDADVTNYSKRQELQNVGTVAPLSVQPVGDMDVYILADNGVRSLRVRDASGNATTEDIGTPIDAVLQPLLAALTDDQKSAACGIVEPSSNRYWCYVPNPDGSTGYIYVFSYFQSSQIAAWARYLPTYQSDLNSAGAYQANVFTYSGLITGKRYAWTAGPNEAKLVCGGSTLTQSGSFIAMATTATAYAKNGVTDYTGALSLTMEFAPSKFFVFRGQVYARIPNALMVYGGSDNLSYENCGVTSTTPFIDSGSPATRKMFTGIDAGFEGVWRIAACCDYTALKYKPIYANNASSFQYQNIGWQASGTHYSFSMTEDGNAYARFASILCHMNQGGEK
jgi:hypothetical protein